VNSSPPPSSPGFSFPGCVRARRSSSSTRARA
jgi:hypothetical protein